MTVYNTNKKSRQPKATQSRVESSSFVCLITDIGRGGGGGAGGGGGGRAVSRRE